MNIVIIGIIVYYLYKKKKISPLLAFIIGFLATSQGSTQQTKSSTYIVPTKTLPRM